MITHRMFRSLCHLVVFCVILTPLGLPRTSAPTVQAHNLKQSQPAITLPSFNETEPNDAITPASQANQIGPSSPTKVWDQTIIGRVGAEGDIDWYTFRLSTPASSVSIKLTNLPADYDLVLASGPISDTGTTNDGLDNVATLGGSINSIGGSINSIGGSINSIGGSINSIGGSINSIGGSINSISVQRGTSTESIDTYLWQPGTYYVAVSGYNGAFSDQPYTLQMNVDGNAWQSLEASVPPAPDVALNLTGNLSSIDTLYLMSTSRMEQLYVESDFAVNQIKSALQSLASAANGYVLDLDELNQGNAARLVNSSDTISDVYDLASKDPSNPLQANRIARLIDNVITAATVRNPSGVSGGQSIPPMPNIQHIVLVGGDSVIPFYRIPDLTSVSNEGTYADYLRQIDSSGLIDPSSPLGGALHYRMILTDDLYGSDEAYRFPGAPLYLPKHAVGRLVENPEEIVTYLQAYQAGPRLIDATNGRAVITGYDFLTDQAQAVSQALGTEGLTRTGLISDTWTKSDLEQTWFNGQLASLNQEPYYIASPSPFQLQSINAHFDHWQSIPATGAGTLYAQDVLNATDYPGDSQQPYFFNRLCYSVGCHSGLNVDDSSVLETPTTPNPALYQADFPQAFNKQAGNWIGNTGYGYGTDQIAYSERLSLLLTEALGERVLGARGVYVGQAIGTALVEAKQRYARRAARLDAYDAKILMETTLYGLPFVPVKVKSPQAPPVEETRVDRVPTVEAPKVTNAGILERVITFTNQFDQGTVARTGSNYPVLRNVQVQDSFVQAGFPAATPTLLTGAAAGLPTLPQFTYNLTGLGPLGNGERLKVKGVEFVGGVYDTLANYNPQISQLITQDLDLLPPGSEPPFDVGNGVWYPEKFYDVSNVATGDSDIDQLLVTAAQFKAATDGTTGTMRPYRSMVFKVVYIDPAAPGAAASLNDNNPPVIDSVRIAPASTTPGIQSTSTRITVTAHDDSPGGVELVDNVYTDEQDKWVPVSFTEVDATHWTATIPVSPTDAHFIISAQDTAGNIGFFSTKGEYAVAAGPAESVKMYLPVVLR